MDDMKFNFEPKTTSDEDLEKYGREQATKAAGAKGSLAGQKAGAQARQAGGSKLFAALQAAQAANDSVNTNFTDAAAEAKALKLNKEQAENDRAFQKAQTEYQAQMAEKAAQKEREFQAAEAEKQREHEKKQSLWNMGASFLASFW